MASAFAAFLQWGLLMSYLTSILDRFRGPQGEQGPPGPQGPPPAYPILPAKPESLRLTVNMVVVSAVKDVRAIYLVRRAKRLVRAQWKSFGVDLQINVTGYAGSTNIFGADGAQLTEFHYYDGPGVGFPALYIAGDLAVQSKDSVDAGLYPAFRSH